MLLVLPLYACAPLPQQPALSDTVVQDPRYAVARPHVDNDYPVSYRVQPAEDGRMKSVDQHVLVHQYASLPTQPDTVKVK